MIFIMESCHPWSLFDTTQIHPHWGTPHKQVYHIVVAYNMKQSHDYLQKAESYCCVRPLQKISTAHVAATSPCGDSSLVS